jgi:RNA polymerase sigma factor (sigma-70 family)
MNAIKQFHDTFAAQLAHIAGHSARHLRGFSSADREEIVAEALLRAWEARETFDPNEGTLAVWFEKFIKAARQQARRRVQRDRTHSSEALDALASLEDPVRATHALHGAERLTADMTEQERAIAGLIAEGHSTRQISATLGVNRGIVKGVAKRLKRIERLAPEAEVMVHTARRTDADEDTRKPAQIDLEIDALPTPPRTVGGNCAPCWRCLWFEGMLPAPYRFRPARHVDPEIQGAIRATEARKIEIANLRLNTLQELQPTAQSGAWLSWSKRFRVTDPVAWSYPAEVEEFEDETLEIT